MYNFSKTVCLSTELSLSSRLSSSHALISATSFSPPLTYAILSCPHPVRVLLKNNFPSLPRWPCGFSLYSSTSLPSLLPTWYIFKHIPYCFLPGCAFHLGRMNSPKNIHKTTSLLESYTLTVDVVPGYFKSLEDRIISKAADKNLIWLLALVTVHLFFPYYTLLQYSRGWLE